MKQRYHTMHFTLAFRSCSTAPCTENTKWNVRDNNLDYTVHVIFTRARGLASLFIDKQYRSAREQIVSDESS